MIKEAEQSAVSLTVPEKLKRLRVRKGWTQAKTAELLSEETGAPVPLWTLRGWEQGKHQPRGHAKAAILRFIKQHA